MIKIMKQHLLQFKPGFCQLIKTFELMMETLIELSKLFIKNNLPMLINIHIHRSTIIIINN